MFPTFHAILKIRNALQPSFIRNHRADRCVARLMWLLGTIVRTVVIRDSDMT
jgi:hypothetical protein